MMPQRRQIVPQGLDISPMAPAPPMQFAAPPTEAGGSGLDSLMQLAQQFRAGQDAQNTASASSMRNQQVDSPLLRKKLPYADMAGAAQYANA